MLKRLENIEGRLCGILVVLLVVAVCVSVAMLSWPLLLAAARPGESAHCQVSQQHHLRGVTNCSGPLSSCRDGCTSSAVDCMRLLVRYDNSTSLAPLYANVLGCGFDFAFTCTEFYERYSEGESFACRLYRDDITFAVPEGPNPQSVVKYLAVSFTPLALLVVCCVYMRRRKLLAHGNKKAKVVKKSVTKDKGPRSFYQRKIMELEFKKRLRELKMKNTGHDVKVFDLENAQTTGALILKPSFSHMLQPPRIIV